ncbi:MAG: pseudouridine synthase [Flavisolibacter sp.]
MKVPRDRYFIVHKPFNMVSQFIGNDGERQLGDLNFIFPEGTHAIGRLDGNSEGVLLLTTNKKVTKLLFQGEQQHKRTYLVQVNYSIGPESIEQLRKGVQIRVKGGGYYLTAACEVKPVPKPDLYQVKEVKTNFIGPTSWLLMELKEGKYHQIRKMMTAVGHRCKRLIRIAIEDIELGDLAPGGVREVEEDCFFDQLKIPKW